ncbi:MAG: shikimate dehydrogenase [Acidimicrobiales bacterium]
MTAGAGRASPRWPSAASTVVGVIGDPVRHSLSPLLHNAAFDALGLDWVSVAFTVGPGALAGALDAMRGLGVRGLSVTMPHKHEAATLVDTLTPTAQRLGVVNCITSESGRLVGDATDGPGFVAALERGTGFTVGGRSCVVVGAGGAGRAVVLALADAGAAEVVVVNRSAARGAEAAALAGSKGRAGVAADIAAADLVVQATPVGMEGAGSEGQLVFDSGLLHDGQLVADLVYHPPVTALLAAADRRGARTFGGIGMLVHQAALALENWTGRPAPVEAMWRAVTDGPG